MLVALNANVTAIDRYKQTPLHQAADSGRASTCQTLASLSANVNAIDRYKVTRYKLPTNSHVVPTNHQYAGRDRNGEFDPCGELPKQATLLQQRCLLVI